MKMLVIGADTFLGVLVIKKLALDGYKLDVIVGNIDKELGIEVENKIFCNRQNIDELKNILLERRYDYIVDIAKEVKPDVMNFLNQATNEHIGRYILCSSTDII